MYPLLSKCLIGVLCSLMLVGCHYEAIETGAVKEDIEVSTVEEQKHKELETVSISAKAVDARSFIEENFIGLKTISEEEAIYKGGIVPHHDVAFEMIDDFYRRLDGKGIDGIILIGPDHQGSGGLCSVGTRSFRTHSGLVEVGIEVQGLLRETSITEAPDSLQEEEHSIGLHMNYINYYFPELPVIPIYVQDRIGMSGANEVMALLQAQLVGKNYLYIGSVDFSHDQTMEVADKNDQRMLFLIEEENFSKIFGLGNDYIDSSAALYMAIEGSRMQGHEMRTVIEHNNAEKVLKQAKMVATTSYYTIGFN